MSRTTVAAGSFESAHEGTRVFGPEIAPPRLGDPVGVGMCERSLRRGVVGRDARSAPMPCASRRRTAFVNANGALESGAADELDRLVHRGVARRRRRRTRAGRHRDGVQPARAGRGGDAAAADRLDRVVERPDALHRAEREPLRERPVPLVEAGRGSSSARSAYASSSKTRTKDVERRAAAPGLRSQPAKPRVVGHAPAAVRLHLDRLERRRLRRRAPARPSRRVRAARHARRCAARAPARG